MEAAKSLALLPLAISLSFAPPPAAAQESKAIRIAVDVPLVNVAFSVRDRKGVLIANVNKDDVQVFEDGVRQELKFLSSERDTPLTIGLLLDRSLSQKGFDDENAYIAQTFFKRILRPQDKAFVVGFDDQIRWLCPLTGSVEELDQALRESNKIWRRATRAGPKVSRGGGSAVLDSIYWPAREKLMSVEGRKALLMIGDGKDNASKLHLSDVIELLQAQDIVFYGFDNGGMPIGDSSTLRNRMPLIADETGGRAFEIGRNALRYAFDLIEQELRALYSLGYVSTNTARDGRFRRIQVRVANPDYSVRARSGYFAR